MSNEKANSSKMKTLNKWLTKLFGISLVKNFYGIPFAKFPFTPDDADSQKYAKVCAEDLADALRDADQYEPIK